jgi:4-amino-4-deoxy-L-arabinose transferase-like glycosyltransferase
VRILTTETADDARPLNKGDSAPGIATLSLVLGVILLANVLGLAFSATDLHYEEAQNWFRSLDIDYFSTTPILLSLIEVMSATCGSGELCIRLPFPIIATASALLAYALARALYDGRVAFWAAIVYATLPAVSAFGLVAMPQIMLAFFFIAGLLMLSIHFDRPTILSGLGLGLLLGLGLGLLLGLGLKTDYAMVYLPICATLYLAATPSLRPVLWAPGTWLAIAIAMLTIAPDLLWFARDAIVDFNQALSNADWTVKRFNLDTTLVFIGMQFVLFGPILLFVLVRLIFTCQTVLPRAKADRFLLYHCVPILVAVLVQAFLFKAKAHWTLPAFPAAAIFVTAALLRHGFQRLLMVSTGLHVAILAGILFFSVFADRFAAVPSFNRLVGWQEFANDLEAAAAASEINAVVLRGGDRVYESLYYLRDTELEIRVFNPRGRIPKDEFELSRGWAYGDTETILLATPRDPSSFGIPAGNAHRIGGFPVQTHFSQSGIFSLYRINPPAKTGFPR